MNTQIRIAFPTALLFIVAICTSCCWSKKHVDVNKMTLEEFEKHVQDENFCVLFFTIKKCMPCIPVYKEINKLSDEYKFRLLKVDSDSNEVLTEHFKVEMFPWIVCLSQGKVLKMFNGYNEVELKKLIHMYYKK